MIKVSIKQPERISCSINKQTIPPVTAPLDITPTEQEQVFEPSGNVTGFAPVIVGGIVASELTATENKVYTPSENEYYSQVNVNVPAPVINLQNKTVTPTEQQQAITADSGYDGLGTVTVGAISATELSVIANGDYTPEENEYYKKVTVNVPQVAAYGEITPVTATPILQIDTGITDINCIIIQAAETMSGERTITTVNLSKRIVAITYTNSAGTSFFGGGVREIYNVDLTNGTVGGFEWQFENGIVTVIRTGAVSTYGNFRPVTYAWYAS